MPSAYIRKKYPKRRAKKRRFPLTELRKRQALTEMIQRVFTCTGSVQPFVEYICEHPFLELLLPLAAQTLQDRCEAGLHIGLDLVDINGIPTLVISAASEASPTEAVNILDEVDEDWRSAVTDVIERIRFDLTSF